MKSKKTFIILTLVLVVVLALAGTLYNGLRDEYRIPFAAESSEQNNANQEKEYNKAPDFTIIDKYGNDVKLSDFIGKPIVLNFWASWCGPCRSEMTDFNKAYIENKDEIEFLMINLTDGQSETMSSALDFISKNKYTFPVYFDTKSEAAYAYSTYSIPTSFFIDRQGNLIASAKGAIDYTTLNKGLDMIKG